VYWSELASSVWWIRASAGVNGGQLPECATADVPPELIMERLFGSEGGHSFALTSPMSVR
jgi:hypothetical protein